MRPTLHPQFRVLPMQPVHSRTHRFHAFGSLLIGQFAVVENGLERELGISAVVVCRGGEFEETIRFAWGGGIGEWRVAAAEEDGVWWRAGENEEVVGYDG